MAEYFYASNGQPTGPVTFEQLDEMVRGGTLTAETLVWQEGMAEWQPYSVLRAGGTATTGLKVAAAPAAAGGLVCSVCGQVFPPDQVIRYGATQVCGGCKPQFLQKLREGANVTGALDYAGFGKRFGAKIIDTILLYIVTIGLNIAVGLGVAGPAPGQQADLGLGLAIMALNLLISLGYPIVFLGKWGQTLGKMALGIKVVSPTGEPIGFGRAAGRVLAEILTGFTIGIGYLMVLWDSERRALHDRLASTRVVNVPK